MTSWPFGVGLDPLCTSVTVAPGKSNRGYYMAARVYKIYL